jgi:Rrf2 family cysteine metabolism transcriptional repressor
METGVRLSTRMRYGCRAMAELAATYPGGAVSVKDMARNQRLSAKYLEHIVSSLRAAGLVKAARGVHGGYVLSRPPELVKLSEIFQILEGSPAPADCVVNPQVCSMRQTCPTRDTWVQIGEAVQGVLEGTTLRDLADRKKRNRNPLPLMYHI